MASSPSEIKTFKDFLDKINILPTNPKYSSFTSSGASVANQNTSAPIKGSSINPPPAKPTSLTLTLKPLRGEAQGIRVNFSETVGQLRAKVAQQFKIEEIDRCRLIRGGKALSDDSQSLEIVFGLVSEVQILHVLEKPPTANATGTTPLSSNEHLIWPKIDALLQSEAGISNSTERSLIIEKFRKSL